uniref:N-acetyllactosaminide beta-1,3-N-acetylglucosaminyltransferase n=1 Tax=Trichogramma kaykai TaxID=54128 RepID=A0ABD2VWJ8_9HYME
MLLLATVRRRSHRCRWAFALLLGGLVSCSLPICLLRYFLLLGPQQQLARNGGPFDDLDDEAVAAAEDYSQLLARIAADATAPRAGSAASSIASTSSGARPAAAALQYAGAYMAERYPGNVSYCSWQYDLPENLNYQEHQLLGSPGATRPSATQYSANGTGRQYLVLPNAVKAQGVDDLPELTLCSHATADQVYDVVELARRWEGPISLAVYVPSTDAALAVDFLERACRCEPAMTRVSVHLIFPRNRPAKLSSSAVTTPFNQLIANDSASNAADPTEQSLSSCSIGEIQASASSANGTERRRSGLAYPINVARNVARHFAPTERVLVSDVELLPSQALASRFLDMLRYRVPKRTVAFVLPVFEVELGVQPPKNKAELLAALRSDAAVYFHRFLCPHCQRFPGLMRWILRPDPGKVRPLIITKREYPHHRWEPIFIGTKYDPLYTEEMSWEGRQDKMTQVRNEFQMHTDRSAIRVSHFYSLTRFLLSDVRDVPTKLSSYYTGRCVSSPSARYKAQICRGRGGRYCRRRRAAASLPTGEFQDLSARHSSIAQAISRRQSQMQALNLIHIDIILITRD